MNFDFNKKGITLQQLGELLTTNDTLLLQTLFAEACQARNAVYGSKVFMRGLIEISSFCKNDCLYCGLRRSNQQAQRYRLTPQQIMQCCANGYAIGFRTFVLQGGEDAWFTDERLVPLVRDIRRQFPDAAITLSLGERSRSSYQALYDAGANRYLLRHETADAAHYATLHPHDMSFDNRIRCLEDLKSIGYQVGCGFMVGAPGQTVGTLYQDLQLIERLQPEMVGIGPFIPAKGTPLEGYRFRAAQPSIDVANTGVSNSVDTTLRLLSIIRLLHPHVLLPATTALATLHPKGREYAMNAGANVIMPNLSPIEDRGKYSIYDNKAATGVEGAEGFEAARSQLRGLGFETPTDRGDYKK